jgi:hypothetical protein
MSKGGQRGFQNTVKITSPLYYAILQKIEKALMVEEKESAA